MSPGSHGVRPRFYLGLAVETDSRPCGDNLEPHRTHLKCIESPTPEVDCVTPDPIETRRRKRPWKTASWKRTTKREGGATKNSKNGRVLHPSVMPALIVWRAAGVQTSSVRLSGDRSAACRTRALTTGISRRTSVLSSASSLSPLDIVPVRPVERFVGPPFRTDSGSFCHVVQPFVGAQGPLQAVPASRFWELLESRTQPNVSRPIAKGG